MGSCVRFVVVHSFSTLFTTQASCVGSNGGLVVWLAIQPHSPRGRARVGFRDVYNNKARAPGIIHDVVTIRVWVGRGLRQKRLASARSWAVGSGYGAIRPSANPKTLSRRCPPGLFIINENDVITGRAGDGKSRVVRSTPLMRARRRDDRSVPVTIPARRNDDTGITILPSRSRCPKLSSLPFPFH